MMLDVHYAAGLFDGEGFFQIDKTQRKDCRGPSFQAHGRITMRDSSLLLLFQNDFGGSLRQSSCETEVRAAYWSWDVCGEGAAAFAERVGPYMRIKKQHAELIVEFQAFKRLNKNRPNSPERQERLLAFYERLRELNKKGVSR